MKQRNSGLLITLLLLCGLNSAFATEPEKAESWEDLARPYEDTAAPAVQNRAITKTGRFQILGLSFGIMDRHDFYNTYFTSLAGRYHFSETHGWEMLKLYWSFPFESRVAKEIRDKTSYRPDSLPSRVQLSTSYVYSPIYGKYAWNSNRVVYFGIYGTVGAGLRLARTRVGTQNRQIFGETGLGMENYLTSKFAIIPEFRLRGYAEHRTSTVLVLEAVVQAGVSWLF